MAIDIGLRIVRGDSLQEIIEKNEENNKVEIRYYEGIALGDNIIISMYIWSWYITKVKREIP